jgi:ribosomal protein S6--L-glutamate ligase
MTSRLAAALRGRGHDVEVTQPDLLVTEVCRGRLVVHPFDDQPLPDAVVLTMSSDHVPAVRSAAELERVGVPVANRPAAVLVAADKVLTAAALAAAGVAAPRTIGVTTIESALTHGARLGYPLVLKAADGSEGNQVRHVVAAADLPAAVRGLRASMGQDVSNRSPLLVQEVMGSSLGHDRRIFVVNGVAQAAMDRVAREGEWRSNLSQGARPVPSVATECEAALAVRAAKALGLDFTTVDIMWGADGPVVIEANAYGDVLDVAMTSGMDLIGSIADLAEMKAGARRMEPVIPVPLADSERAEITTFCVGRLRAKARQLNATDGVGHGV